jgi:hypothetical protein
MCERIQTLPTHLGGAGEDPFLSSWEKDLTKHADRDRYASSIDLEKQFDVERTVSEHIARHMSVSVLGAANPDAALLLERQSVRIKKRHSGTDRQNIKAGC